MMTGEVEQLAANLLGGEPDSSLFYGAAGPSSQQKLEADIERGRASREIALRCGHSSIRLSPALHQTVRASLPRSGMRLGRIGPRANRCRSRPVPIILCR